MTGAQFKRARSALGMSIQGMCEVSRIATNKIQAIEATRGVVRMNKTSNRLLDAIWTIEHMREVHAKMSREAKNMH
jgi:hypothetical protein